MQHVRVSLPDGLSPMRVQELMNEIGDLLVRADLEHNVVPATDCVPLTPMERKVATLGLACVPAIVDFVRSIGLAPPITDEQLLDLEKVGGLLAV